ncbi:ferredoxin reductase family protein [Dactylosporangium matsuzakiense]|uniref:Oxidoreductase n=1 Tax=Dactylosporangium matsuzakiense TaxID=53360 RepID=A0A9W6KIJ5_9ACTN|nr:ferric reductase-like transmembrane domain-containing protein [Dactylosporangium matsuzakiense]UWZ46060.1 ferric reductase-like transmembrane domain-containing protein [Dactylosporangium matsuzakiense]GLL00189.1 oxidoreductase [Dactylosporangium matsuzakiense]
MTVPRQRQASSLAAPAARPVEHHTAGRFILRTLFWSGLALAVLPWWLGTRAGSIETSADVLQAAGRVTGLIAGYLLLTQVILMSRLGFLERWIGARHLGLWHRELGGSVLVMILAHGALITVGYAYADSKSATSELGVLLSQYDDMVTAFIAAGMLVCIGLLSIRRLRRALPYELWYFLHLTSYLALLLGFAHQFSDGQELYKPGLGRTAWIGFYVVTIAAVVLGRIVGPLWLNLRHRLRVADVVAEGPNMVSIYITGARLHDLDAKAGQFFRWRFLGRGLWWQAHPFSLSAAPNGRWLRLTVKTVGDHTQRLRAMRPGTRIFVEGPWGDFTAARRIKQRALLIAAGSGIGPIRALLEELPPGAIVIYRASAVHDLHLRHELEQLSELRHAQLWFVVGDRRAPGPRRLFTPAGLRDLVPDVTERDVYLCGPDGLIQQSLAVLRRLRVPRRQVHLDPFEF